MPVTYADVWEFWLRHREVAAAVDFVSIHILPYWEDFPIPARDAPGHVDAIRRRMVAAFPDKDILVGEFGWPSAGRMREGALPSPVNQARVMHEVLAHARRENYRVNLIEAYDQPWKRQLEGTVGGHWGIYDAYRRQAKFVWGGLVSNHPHWRWQAAGGVGLAAVVFGVALAARRGIGGGSKRRRVAAYRGNCDRLRSLDRLDGRERTARKPHPWRLAALPRLGRRRFDGAGRKRRRAGVRARGRRVFAQILGRAEQRPRAAIPLFLGLILLMTAVLSVQAALGLVFDGRYRDFPFAPLTGAAIPLLVLGRWRRRSNVPAAEKAMAVTLAVSAVYIVGNESVANWQALWFCGWLARAGSYSGAGAGRARLRINSAAARPARSALCRTRPNAVAASATNISTIDGRTRLSKAARERDPAEHRVVVQDDGEPERGAQPGAEAALAGQRDLRIFDREIAQIKRLAEREQANQQQPIGLAGGGQKEPGLHGWPHYAAGFPSGQPLAIRYGRWRSPPALEAAIRGDYARGVAFPGVCSRIPPFPLRRTRI